MCHVLFRLKPLDIQFMKELHNLVNIIPVIAKSDTLTPTEIKTMKTKVCITSVHVSVYCMAMCTCM